MCNLVFMTGPWASTKEILETSDVDVQDPYPQSPPETGVHKRQKSKAVLKSPEPGAVLARLSVPMTQTTSDIIDDMCGHYAVPDGDQHSRIE